MHVHLHFHFSFSLAKKTKSKGKHFSLIQPILLGSETVSSCFAERCLSYLVVQLCHIQLNLKYIILKRMTNGDEDEF